MEKQAFVYILASKKNGTLYTGVTSNLDKRMYEHKDKSFSESFTAKYFLDKLVWYLAGEDIASAIELEKKIKNRNREWKIALIEKDNPEWKDLSLEFMDPATSRRVTEGGKCRVVEDAKHRVDRRGKVQGSGGRKTQS
jgi:putative endonuclease